jgi:hypothetical protein
VTAPKAAALEMPTMPGSASGFAQEALHRCARQSEAEADESTEDGARQAQFDQHERRQALPAGEPVAERGEKVEPGIADGERERCHAERGGGEQGDEPPIGHPVGCG